MNLITIISLSFGSVLLFSKKRNYYYYYYIRNYMVDSLKHARAYKSAARFRAYSVTKSPSSRYLAIRVAYKSRAWSADAE